MRIVVALGGNALLRRGQPMTAENQRENVKIAAQALAPIATGNQLVISHGNGPQVGLLALQSEAYDQVEAYPLDILGSPDRGNDWLYDRAGARKSTTNHSSIRYHTNHGGGRPRRPSIRQTQQADRTDLQPGESRGISRREGLDDEA